MVLKEISKQKVFDGWHQQFSHYSSNTNCTMRFGIFLPPQANEKNKVPVVYWLSGLTCTDENFMQKAGALKKAAELGIAIVAPDTSPRGEDIPDDPKKSYDLGLGAGFYVNSTQEPWRKNYHMYSYVVDELPDLIEANFPVSQERAISGHSMGGHGALMIALRNPEKYASVSAFSPISNPINCPWGQKAFHHYLGDDETSWQEYDSSKLMRKMKQGPPALVDQGSSDNFLDEQLRPHALQQSADKSGYPLTLRIQNGYDHSYYFISTFINAHLEFHADHIFSK
ncbi:MAG: S-formylglutathione hydrolase [Oleiphilaceae bacterium]|jgi:S-formylglutathione hydrolase